MTPVELSELVKHFGGPAGVLHHLSVHHPHVNVTNLRVHSMAYAHAPYHVMHKKDYEIGAILKADKPNFKGYTTRHRSSPVGYNVE